MPPRRFANPGIAALVLLALIWGYTWIAMKEGLRFAAPFDFGAMRALPGALLLFAAMAWRKAPFAPVAPGRLLVLGLFQTTGFVGFTNLALATGAVGKTAVLVYTMPFWTLLLAWPILGERVRGMQWLAVVLGAAGLALVLEPWRLTGTPQSKLFAVLAGLCWAVSAVLAKELRAKVSMDLLSLTAWQMLFGGIALAAIALLVPEPPVVWTGYFVLVYLYNVALGTVAGWILWLYILSRLSAGVASLSILSVPALGVLLSRLHYGEQPGSVEVAGMLLIGASLALLSWLAIRQRRAVEPEMGQE